MDPTLNARCKWRGMPSTMPKLPVLLPIYNQRSPKRPNQDLNQQPKQRLYKGPSQSFGDKSFDEQIEDEYIPTAVNPVPLPIPGFNDQNGIPCNPYIQYLAGSISPSVNDYHYVMNPTQNTECTWRGGSTMPTMPVLDLIKTLSYPKLFQAIPMYAPVFGDQIEDKYIPNAANPYPAPIPGFYDRHGQCNPYIPSCDFACSGKSDYHCNKCLFDVPASN